MATRVGTVTQIGALRPADLRERLDAATTVDDLKSIINDMLDGLDGRVRVHNSLENAEWAGRLLVLSGGSIVFDIVDERGLKGQQMPDSMLEASEREVIHTRKTPRVPSSA